MFKSENAGVSWVFGTLKTFKRYILKLLNNMQRSVLLRVVRASSFCCLTIKKLRERRGLGNLRHFKDQPTEKSGIVYDNLFLSSQACVANKLSTHAASVRVRFLFLGWFGVCWRGSLPRFGTYIGHFVTHFDS